MGTTSSFLARSPMTKRNKSIQVDGSSPSRTFASCRSRSNDGDWLEQGGAAILRLLFSFLLVATVGLDKAFTALLNACVRELSVFARPWQAGVCYSVGFARVCAVLPRQRESSCLCPSSVSP